MTAGNDRDAGGDHVEHLGHGGELGKHDDRGEEEQQRQNPPDRRVGDRDGQQPGRDTQPAGGEKADPDPVQDLQPREDRDQPPGRATVSRALSIGVPVIGALITTGLRIGPAHGYGVLVLGRHKRHGPIAGPVTCGLPVPTRRRGRMRRT